jgi:hypothetical protein
MRLLCPLLVAIGLMAGCGPAPSSATASVAEQAVTPPDYVTLSPHSIKFRRGDLALTINPAAGGRISSLRFAGKERLITQREADGGNNWGSVLWPSPQQSWGWPPPAALDAQPYKVSVTERGVRLTSGVDPDLKIAFAKHYRLGKVANTLVADYRITNHAKRPVTLAPWEVTRVPAAGAVFFPTGETEPVKGPLAPLPFTSVGDISWFAYPSGGTGPDNLKLITDGEEGWLAYHHNDWLLVKVFDNVPAPLMAPGEGEIEVYASGNNTYLELEQQGFLTTLMPQQALTWQVVWVCDRVSPQADRDVLIKRARTLAGRARTL